MLYRFCISNIYIYPAAFTYICFHQHTTKTRSASDRKMQALNRDKKIFVFSIKIS